MFRKARQIRAENKAANKFRRPSKKKDHVDNNSYSEEDEHISKIPRRSIVQRLVELTHRDETCPEMLEELLPQEKNCLALRLIMFLEVAKEKGTDSWKSNSVSAVLFHELVEGAKIDHERNASRTRTTLPPLAGSRKAKIALASVNDILEIMPKRSVRETRTPVNLDEKGTHGKLKENIPLEEADSSHPRKKEGSTAKEGLGFRNAATLKRELPKEQDRQSPSRKRISKESGNGGFQRVRSHQAHPSSTSIKPGESSSRKSEQSSATVTSERLASCDPELIKKIEFEILHHGEPTTFQDIAGLDLEKKCVNEVVCWPLRRPDLFIGLRSLPRGLLLFGPPGTGKTLIGKAIAHESGATFFNISSSSLTSKWIGEGEKLVRTLFALACEKSPSIVFIDEVDSLLSQRNSEENEASRRIKTEFLVQLDGAGTSSKDRVLVIGATNRPQELDEAARRRFVKKLYIPLPDSQGRRQLVDQLLANTVHSVSEPEVEDIVRRTKGFSGADLRALCTEAAMGPIRDMQGDILTVRAEEVPSIACKHFQDALESVRPSVSATEVECYESWNREFGTFSHNAGDT